MWPSSLSASVSLPVKWGSESQRPQRLENIKRNATKRVPLQGPVLTAVTAWLLCSESHFGPQRIWLGSTDISTTAAPLRGFYFKYWSLRESGLEEGKQIRSSLAQYPPSNLGLVKKTTTPVIVEVWEQHMGRSGDSIHHGATPSWCQLFYL